MSDYIIYDSDGNAVPIKSTLLSRGQEYILEGIGRPSRLGTPEDHKLVVRPMDSVVRREVNARMFGMRVVRQDKGA